MATDLVAHMTIDLLVEDSEEEALRAATVNRYDQEKEVGMGIGIVVDTKAVMNPAASETRSLTDTMTDATSRGIRAYGSTTGLLGGFFRFQLLLSPLRLGKEYRLHNRLLLPRYSVLVRPIQ